MLDIDLSRCIRNADVVLGNTGLLFVLQNTSLICANGGLTLSLQNAGLMCASAGLTRDLAGLAYVNAGFMFCLYNEGLTGLTQSL